MKIYLVYEDNGECYEDYCDSVTKVFDTKEKAKLFISKEKKKKINKQTMYRNAIRFWIIEMVVE